MLHAILFDFLFLPDGQNWGSGQESDEESEDLHMGEDGCQPGTLFTGYTVNCILT
jgi:hypothetical protein